MNNNFTEIDKEYIIDYLKSLNSNTYIRIIKNHLGLFHIDKRNTPNNEFLSPESWVSILNHN